MKMLKFTEHMVLNLWTNFDTLSATDVYHFGGSWDFLDNVFMSVLSDIQ